MEINKYVLVAAIIWSLAWKGVALWRSARESRLGWFSAILVIQSLGLLEIIYIFLISEEKNNE